MCLTPKEIWQTAGSLFLVGSTTTPTCHQMKIIRTRTRTHKRRLLHNSSTLWMGEKELEVARASCCAERWPRQAFVHGLRGEAGKSGQSGTRVGFSFNRGACCTDFHGDRTGQLASAALPLPVQRRAVSSILSCLFSGALILSRTEPDSDGSTIIVLLGLQTEDLISSTFCCVSLTAPLAHPWSQLWLCEHRSNTDDLDFSSEHPARSGGRGVRVSRVPRSPLVFSTRLFVGHCFMQSSLLRPGAHAPLCGAAEEIRWQGCGAESDRFSSVLHLSLWHVFDFSVVEDWLNIGCDRNTQLLQPYGFSRLELPGQQAQYPLSISKMDQWLLFGWLYDFQLSYCPDDLVAKRVRRTTEYTSTQCLQTSDAGLRPTRRNLVGWTEGALGLGCRSRAPHGVPRTEPSAPCCVAAAPELFIECRGQSVQRSREGQVFWLLLPGSSTSAADEALLRGFKAREQPSQWQVGKLSAAKLKKDHAIHSVAPHARRSTRNTKISDSCKRTSSAYD